MKITVPAAMFNTAMSKERSELDQLALVEARVLVLGGDLTGPQAYADGYRFSPVRPRRRWRAGRVSRLLGDPGWFLPNAYLKHRPAPRRTCPPTGTVERLLSGPEGGKMSISVSVPISL